MSEKHEEEIRHAISAFERATSSIRSATPGKPGFGIEAVYGQEYQRLVRLGIAPQLKKKYRG